MNSKDRHRLTGDEEVLEHAFAQREASEQLLDVDLRLLSDEALLEVLRIRAHYSRILAETIQLLTDERARRRSDAARGHDHAERPAHRSGHHTHDPPGVRP